MGKSIYFVKSVLHSALVMCIFLFAGTLIIVGVAPQFPTMGVISYTETDRSSWFSTLRIRDIQRHIDLPIAQFVNGKASWSPDGKQLLYAVTTRQGQHFEVFNIRSGDKISLPIEDMLLTSGDWSPEGDCFAFTSNQSVFRYCSGDNAPEMIVKNSVDRFVTWSPDGEQLLYSSFRGASTDLYTYDLKTEEETRITQDGRAKTSPTFTPDGEMVLYGTFFRDTGQIMSLHIETGNVQQVTNRSEGYSPAISSDGQFLAYVRASMTTGWDIFMLDLQSGEVVPVVTRNGDQVVPAWMP
jgi:TolB protein